MEKKEISQAAALLGRKGGAARTPAKAQASRENGKKGGKEVSNPDDTVTLLNPWTGAECQEMTWAQLKEWASTHVHANDMARWRRAARRAFLRGDGKLLGIMIIGS